MIRDSWEGHVAKEVGVIKEYQTMHDVISPVCAILFAMSTDLNFAPTIVARTVNLEEKKKANEETVSAFSTRFVEDVKYEGEEKTHRGKVASKNISRERNPRKSFLNRAKLRSFLNGRAHCSRGTELSSESCSKNLDSQRYF